MITVHGLLGAPSARLLAEASAADWVVGGRRHLDALGVDDARRITLGSVPAAIEQLLILDADAPVVVVASGDPLFFGIVRTLRAAGLRPRVVTAPSSIAAAFASVGLPWDDAAVVSAHGRPLDEAVAIARTHPKVAVFTSAAHGVRELAGALAGLNRTFVVAERLGEPDERVRVLDHAAAVSAEVAEPNVVLVLADPPDAPDRPWSRAAAGALADDEPAPAPHDAPGDAGSRSTPPDAPVEVGSSRQADASRRADAGTTEGPVIGQVTSGAASLARAAAVDAIVGPTRRYTEGAVEGLPLAWRECDLIISHLALGATTRLIAPLLRDKGSDPGVVVLDEAGRFAVPLVGGHGGGANELATRLADGLGATAVLTTATDALGVPGLDTLGWPWRGDVARVTRAILDGRPVEVVRDRPWPLPALPGNVTIVDAPADHAEARVLLTDRSTVPDQSTVPDRSAAPGCVPGSTGVRDVLLDREEPANVIRHEIEQALTHGRARTDHLPTVVLHPPSLVAGMGCNRGTPASALHDLLTNTLAAAGLAIESLAAMTSVDAKADEPGLVELAAALGVPLVTYPADELAARDVPNPSAAPAQAVGTPSVAEASVLARGAELIVEKTKTTEATCAIGRLPARGKLSIVGLGPGALDLLTPRATRALREASVVVGYRPYIARVKSVLRPGTRIVNGVMGREEERTSAALALAREGRTVALVSSGDAGVYAMASPALELGTEGIDVEVIPGVTASLAVAAILGAPLGHDHATISLSDLHTDWDTIVRRVRAAAEADLVTVLYNPRSRKRRHQLPAALAVFAEHRSPETPVAVVEDAERPDQRVVLSTLGAFDPEVVTMNALVVVGSSTTRYLPTEGRTLMVTPRDYHWMP